MERLLASIRKKNWIWLPEIIEKNLGKGANRLCSKLEESKMGIETQRINSRFWEYFTVQEFSSAQNVWILWYFLGMSNENGNKIKERISKYN